MAKLVIDDAFLDEVGIHIVDKTERKAKLDAIYADLETRVGNTLANEMNEEELDEFETLADEGDEDKMLEWLEDVRPDYHKVVEMHYKIIRAELKAKRL